MTRIHLTALTTLALLAGGLSACSSSSMTSTASQSAVASARPAASPSPPASATPDPAAGKYPPHDAGATSTNELSGDWAGYVSVTAPGADVFNRIPQGIPVSAGPGISQAQAQAIATAFLREQALEQWAHENAEPLLFRHLAVSDYLYQGPDSVLVKQGGHLVPPTRCDFYGVAIKVVVIPAALAEAYLTIDEKVSPTGVLGTVAACSVNGVDASGKPVTIPINTTPLRLLLTGSIVTDPTLGSYFRWDGAGNCNQRQLPELSLVCDQ